MKIQLPGPDRERLGAPEVIDCDLSNGLSVKEAMAVERAIAAIPEDIEDEDLQALRQCSPDDVLRLMIPDAQPHPSDPNKMRAKFSALGMLLRVWLGLHRAKIHVPLHELDFSSVGLLSWIDVEREPEGKDTSVTSGASTRSKSRRSGRSTRSTN